MVPDPNPGADPNSVLTLGQAGRVAATRLLLGLGMDLRIVPAHEQIPGSYWGEREAGLRGTTLYARLETPLHSVLHEASHFLCMTPERRVGLDTDAGGDYAEEDAVCYLQILLADALEGVGSERMWRDMDAWGYTFRLGSARAWFEQDAREAREWLGREGLLDATGRLTGRARG